MLRFFRPLLTAIVDDAEDSNLDWDLIYLGRKRLDPSKDGAVPVPGSRYAFLTMYCRVRYLLLFVHVSRLQVSNDSVIQLLDPGLCAKSSWC